MVQVKNLLAEEGSYSGKAAELYRLLADLCYVIGKYEGKLGADNFKEAVDGYKDAYQNYVAYYEAINDTGKQRSGIMRGMLGLEA